MTKLICKITLLTVGVLIGTAALAQEGPTMGGAGDVAFAQDLWRAMAQAKLVGPDEKPLKPFFGGAKPHGIILEIAYQDLNVNGHTGFVVVKRNYDGDGVSEDAVAQNRMRYRSSTTVMFQRETGYDSDNKNWFWAKYTPDGGLFNKSTKGQNIPLAGRIAKNQTTGEYGGCLYCHRSAGGGDYIFYPHIPAP